MLNYTDAKNLSGQEILDEYNRHANKWRKAKFSSKEEGLAALIKLGAINLEETVKVIEEPEVEVIQPKGTDIRTDVNNAIEMLRSVQSNIEKNRKPPADQERPQGRTDAHRNHWAKRIVSLVPVNPRRPGSQASFYFDLMVASKTVGDYLDKFPTKEEKKKASQWLSNTIRDNYIDLA